MVPVPAATTTPENVAVASAEIEWLVTANPKYAVLPMAIVLLPIAVHVVPSDELNALNSEPDRTSFTQYGAGCAGPAVCVLTPPIVILC